MDELLSPPLAAERFCPPPRSPDRGHHCSSRRRGPSRPPLEHFLFIGRSRIPFTMFFGGLDWLPAEELSFAGLERGSGLALPPIKRTALSPPWRPGWPVRSGFRKGTRGGAAWQFRKPTNPLVGGILSRDDEVRAFLVEDGIIASFPYFELPSKLLSRTTSSGFPQKLSCPLCRHREHPEVPPYPPPTKTATLPPMTFPPLDWVTTFRPKRGPKRIQV
ncbi:hypothetical protein GWK47_043197 [Chionoecetes opilio]|uniref:Uncharacterized protein n=1 Tax=Chionoecetes opilio TaxID=41210 RepID=A0A8J4YGE9_CHIOP|nr:hypothetical protein GWK47_043197 [Chionoecetes opilio]